LSLTLIVRLALDKTEALLARGFKLSGAFNAEEKIFNGSPDTY